MAKTVVHKTILANDNLRLFQVRFRLLDFPDFMPDFHSAHRHAPVRFGTLDQGYAKVVLALLECLQGAHAGHAFSRTIGGLLLGVRSISALEYANAL